MGVDNPTGRHLRASKVKVSGVLVLVNKSEDTVAKESVQHSSPMQHPFCL